MGTPRLDSLTGMRFVAVVLVFCSHVAFLLFEPRFSWISKTFDAGPVGVSFFFILSGFVLTWSARPQDDSRSFYRRRLARIGPNHLVAWLLALGVLLLEGATLGFRGGFASLFLVQAWVPSEPIFYAANSVTWSLSCEIAFYAAFPVLLPAMGHAPSASRKRWIVLLLLANVGIALFGQWTLEGEAQLWFIYILPATRALEFAIGMLVAFEVREGGLRSRRLSSCGAGCARSLRGSGRAAPTFRVDCGHDTSFRSADSCCRPQRHGWRAIAASKQVDSPLGRVVLRLLPPAPVGDPSRIRTW